MIQVLTSSVTCIQWPEFAPSTSCTRNTLIQLAKLPSFFTSKQFFLISQRTGFVNNCNKTHLIPAGLLTQCCQFTVRTFQKTTTITVIRVSLTNPTPICQKLWKSLLGNILLHRTTYSKLRLISLKCRLLGVLAL